MSIYTDGFDHGYLAGIQAGQELAAADLETRDDMLARRIVALLLQHDYQQQLVKSVVALNPYPGRTATGVNWRELLDGAA